MKPTLKEE
jgi:hypothetical protein